MLISNEEFKSLNQFLLTTTLKNSIEIYNKWRSQYNIKVHSTQKYLMLIEYIQTMKNENPLILKEL